MWACGPGFFLRTQHHLRTHTSAAGAFVLENGHLMKEYIRLGNAAKALEAAILENGVRQRTTDEKQQRNCADREPASDPPSRHVADPEDEHRQRPQRHNHRDRQSHQDRNRALRALLWIGHADYLPRNEGRFKLSLCS